jgi:hypothetical protein
VTDQDVLESVRNHAMEYQKDPEATVPELAACLALDVLLRDWQARMPRPFDLAKMEADLRRLKDVLRAFEGKIACLRAMRDGDTEE